jgi:MarR family transcriptional regulator, transcriptional regulator for hemolysin
MSRSEKNWRPRGMPTLLIATAARMLARIADTRLRDLGISTSQFPVLVALKDGARLSQKELTRLAGVEQPSMAQLLARMERDGLIRRDPDPTDGRSSLISLSKKALGMMAPARAILVQGNREALEGFDDAEVEVLVTLLLRVMANVGDGTDCPPAKRGRLS